jgi:GTP pyrophosphokinase
VILKMGENLDLILSKIKKYNPKANVELIKKAFIFASKLHEGQKRVNGEALIKHPIAVAEILAELKLDSSSIAAALIHEAVEYKLANRERIEKLFGKDVAKLAWGVKIIGDLKLRGSKEEDFVNNLQKMIIIMAKDLRIILIKLADRYHNLQSLNVLPPEKQKRIAEETLEIYAPLAEKLGIGEIKGKLEDLAFPYLYPKEYEWVKKYSEPYYRKADSFLSSVKKNILNVLLKEGINAEIHTRTKHLYSLYKKLLRPEINRDITKIYDIVALRILVDTIEECYIALGIVHRLYRHIPEIGVSDFIAAPKPNGYRSIHTKVCDKNGRIFEVQIRTRQMHEEAENGIAAHWYYAEKKRKGSNDNELQRGFLTPSEKIELFQKLMIWRKEVVESKGFINSLKVSNLCGEIFVFSPKGDVYQLPKDSTPVDFAYKIHTELGNLCLGAKVNGKQVPLDYKLKNGEIVEIVPSKCRKGPSLDWLNFVRSKQAKDKIRRYFSKDKKENI